MNWDALGAAAELLGALAVIVTLWFLAQQIRSANRLKRGENRDATVDQFDRWRVTLASDPALASLWLRGARGEELDDEAAFRFDQLVTTYFMLHLTWASRAQESDAPEVIALAARTLADDLCGNERRELRRRWLARDFGGAFTDAVNAEIAARGTNADS